MVCKLGRRYKYLEEKAFAYAFLLEQLGLAK